MRNFNCGLLLVCLVSGSLGEELATLSHQVASISARALMATRYFDLLVGMWNPLQAGAISEAFGQEDILLTIKS